MFKRDQLHTVKTHWHVVLILLDFMRCSSIVSYLSVEQYMCVENTNIMRGVGMYIFGTVNGPQGYFFRVCCVLRRPIDDMGVIKCST